MLTKSLIIQVTNLNFELMKFFNLKSLLFLCNNAELK